MMDDVRKTIAENLIKICELEGVRQKDITDAFGISSGTVNNWFKATNGIDMTYFWKLCEFLHVTPNQMFGVEPLNSTLTQDEEYLVNVYRQLDKKERKHLKRYAGFIAGEEEEQ